MRFIVILLLGLQLLFICCSKESINPGELVWQKIVVPDVSTIYSIFGNLEDQLLIAGLHGVVKTRDGGKNWYTVFPDIEFGEFIQKNDTLIGVTNDKLDYYSLDMGESWNSYPHEIHITWNNTVISSQGFIYKYEPTQTYPKRPDTVLRSKDGGLGWENMLLPESNIYSIYLDNSDRLYIGVVGWNWNESTEMFEDDDDQSGFLYYIK